MNSKDKYEILVVGLGHAGCEAALVASRRGHKTAAFSINLDNIAMMPCNPSIGGPGKSHLVYELSAYGGEMGRNIDNCFIHARMLNESRGPAVYSLRMQADKKAYQYRMRKVLEGQENLDLIEAEVAELMIKNDVIYGIRCADGREFNAPCVILATGTFLGSRIIIGKTSYIGGPHNELSATKLSDSLRNAGLQLDRFQTATPPRVRRESLDYSKFSELPCDDNVGFSIKYKGTRHCNIPSYLAYTNEDTIKIVQDNLQNSPIVIGNITDSGPRYCPSIDRKVIKFPKNLRQQIFIEPEGENSEEIYLQGLTTSMPADIQEKIIRTVSGFERAEIMRYGYAIEYDYLPPGQLKITMENRNIKGLYSAGQINGTSGYEEAAVQGFVAGLNATLFLENKEPFIPARFESYIGVLVEDLVTRTIVEPYRMMTSRAEFRLSLRQDNADKRCIDDGYKYGLIDKEIYSRVKNKYYAIDKELGVLAEFKINPNKENNKILDQIGSVPIKKTYFAKDILNRKEIKYPDLKKFGYELNSDIPQEWLDIILTEIKYSGYLCRQQKQIERLRKLEDYKIPEGFDFSKIKALSNEAKDNLHRECPNTIGEAARVCGVNINDISIILNYITGK
ncbi:tRNA uridine-5-carboxymethylaminomethyl(34) synthesis enzyme MnmG [bacterium]|nr:tRNA uridine-5-carboxymethylaminomethyl(34) synthesis enzyme MnmG [bacterium]